MNAKDVIRLKEKLEEKEQLLEREKGKIESIQERFRNEFNCDTIEEMYEKREIITANLAEKKNKKKEIEIKLEKLVTEVYPEFLSGCV